MTDVWTFQIREVQEVPKLSGFDVEATDGHIGKIDEATYEVGSSCLVVDTGFWIFGKKRMLPGSVIRRIDLDNRQVFVGLTKDQIKQAPDHDEQRRDEEEYRRSLGDYYSRY